MVAEREGHLRVLLGLDDRQRPQRLVHQSQRLGGIRRFRPERVVGLLGECNRVQPGKPRVHGSIELSGARGGLRRDTIAAIQAVPGSHQAVHLRRHRRDKRIQVGLRRDRADRGLEVAQTGLEAGPPGQFGKRLAPALDPVFLRFL